MLNPIHQEYKEHGLILSPLVTINLPPVRQPQKTFLEKFGALFMNEQTPVAEVKGPIVMAVPTKSIILIGRANTLLTYRFTLNQSTHTLMVQDPKIINLRFLVHNIHIWEDSTKASEKKRFPFLVQTDNDFHLFILNLHELVATHHQTISFPNFMALKFISDKQFITVGANAMIEHWVMHGDTFQMKGVLVKLFNIKAQESMMLVRIVGKAEEDIESLLQICYVISDKKRQIVECLKFKEIIRTYNGSLDHSCPDYIVLQKKQASILSRQFEVIRIGEYICVQLRNSVLVIKKKYDKYLLIDSVSEKMSRSVLRLYQNGLILTNILGGGELQLSVLEFGDPKCACKLMDSIQLDPELLKCFSRFWSYRNHKKNKLIIAFQREHQIILGTIIKIEPMKKMIEVTRKDKELNVVQEMALNLGVSKEEFYHTLWIKSTMEIQDIYKLLLPCGNIQVIKNELQARMCRRKIAVPDLIKILEKIAGIIKQKMLEKLDNKIIREYLKNDFLYRKVCLKQKQKSLDFNELKDVIGVSLVDLCAGIIKEELYPEKQLVDPLHAMIDRPERESITLNSVLQNFRLLILENYIGFLIDVLSHFTGEQILQILKNFDFLLPRHPFTIQLYEHDTEYMTEKELLMSVEKNPHFNYQTTSMFKDVTSLQFFQEMSRERIAKELHKHYSTSTIKEQIDKLNTAQKLTRHGFISCSMADYTRNLKLIEGTKIFLRVCEFVNEKDAFHPTLLDEIIKQFQEKHTLKDEHLQQVKLYAGMNRIFLRTNFKSNQDKQFSIMELIQLKPHNLIAIFFLGNKQKKDFLFGQFRDLYVKVYSSPKQFNTVIQLFVHSSNCSFIELQICIRNVVALKSEFMIENQHLIDILMNGFCMKLNLSQENETGYFVKLMGEVLLSKPLGNKIVKIMKLQECAHIFSAFDCDKLTLYECLRMQENNQIFKVLLEKHFQSKCKNRCIYIEGDTYQIDSTRTILTVFIYLRENVYFEVEEKSLMLTYAQSLIEWRKFSILHSIIYDEQYLAALQIDPSTFLDELVKTTIDGLEKDREAIYDDETKEYLRDIIELYPTDHPVQKKELAKLRLVDIFESWGLEVELYFIWYLCDQWTNFSEREYIMQGLLRNYTSKFTLDTLIEVYSELEKTHQDVEIYDENELLSYCLLFAEQMLESKFYDKTLQAVNYVRLKGVPNEDIPFRLLTQPFLKLLAKKYPSENQIPLAKQIIEYYTQNFMDNSLTKQLFESNLGTQIFDGKVQKSILVPTVIQDVVVPLQMLWRLVNAEIERKKPVQPASQSREGNTQPWVEQLYYLYYFIIMVFRHQEVTLTKLHRISYSYKAITAVLVEFGGSDERKEKLWTINMYVIYSNLLRGLYAEGLKRINITQQSQKEVPEAIIKANLLSDKVAGKNPNKQLIDSINFIEKVIASDRLVSAKYIEPFAALIADKSEKKEEEEAPQNNMSTDHEEKVGVTISLNNIIKIKDELSRTLGIISEKQLLDSVYVQVEQYKSDNDKPKNPNIMDTSTPLEVDYFEMTLERIKEKIIAGDYQGLVGQGIDYRVNEAVRELYQSRAKNFHEMVNILYEFKLADTNRITIGKLCNLYCKNFTDHQLFAIFPYHFFFPEEQQPISQDGISEAAYKCIREYLQKLIRFNSFNQGLIKALATSVGYIFSKNIFKRHLYVDTLIEMSSLEFSPATSKKVTVIAELLNDFPGKIPQIDRISDAFSHNLALGEVVLKTLRSNQG